MPFELLECVVLAHDSAEDGLRAGDLGTIVHVHEQDAFEVEFVTADGRTQALLTLVNSDIRSAGPQDIAAARSAQPAT